jgi:hypothetical protein
MRKIIVLLAVILAAGAAQAQIKCWTEGGRRVCGDAPPPGAKVTTVRGTGSTAPAPADAAPESKDAAKKGASQGPLTPAEREQEYRKRQAESQKAAEKSAAEAKALEAKRENCERAKDAQRTLESGQRIARVDGKGERYFLDEGQIAQEMAKARKAVQDSCN